MAYGSCPDRSRDLTIYHADPQTTVCTETGSFDCDVVTSPDLGVFLFMTSWGRTKTLGARYPFWPMRGRVPHVLLSCPILQAYRGFKLWRWNGRPIWGASLPACARATIRQLYGHVRIRQSAEEGHLRSLFDVCCACCPQSARLRFSFHQLIVCALLSPTDTHYVHKRLYIVRTDRVSMDEFMTAWRGGTPAVAIQPKPKGIPARLTEVGGIEGARAHIRPHVRTFVRSREALPQEP